MYVSTQVLYVNQDVSKFYSLGYIVYPYVNFSVEKYIYIYIYIYVHTHTHISVSDRNKFGMT
jgi:hypothetical protein